MRLTKAKSDWLKSLPRDAAGAAAWSAITPAVKLIQKSAMALLERMLAP